LPQVQTQFGSAPLTESARLLQSRAFVQMREQEGYVPVYPEAQALQSAVPPYWVGQVAQVGPVHELRHEHVHPTFVFPVTEFACPLQFATTVQVR
jgi:hypothetical protein